MPLSVQNSVRQQPLSIGIVVQRFPTPSETFIVTKVLGLLAQGFDLQIFAAAQSPHWNRFAALKDREDIRQRIRVGPPTSPLRRVVTTGVLYLIATLIRHPWDFVRFVMHCWVHRKQHPLGFLKAFYTRLHFVGARVDILHIEFDTQALGITDLKHCLRCKLLLSARGTFQRTTILDNFPDAPNQIFKDADGYHFISRYLQDNTHRLGLPKTVPTWIIEPAIDLTLFTAPAEHQKGGDSESILHLITVARLAWQKGYEFAIDAVALVDKARIRVQYTILGEGPYEEAIVFAARQSGLLDRGIVAFKGAVTREEVAQYLARADIMIHAAVEEGFCNAVIEGQAMGLPVIASDAGGLPENIEDGVTGFIVPRRDPWAMAEKIILLAQNPELRRQMGEVGRKRAHVRFNINDQIAAFKALYLELADEQH